MKSDKKAAEGLARAYEDAASGAAENIDKVAHEISDKIKKYTLEQKELVRLTNKSLITKLSNYEKQRLKIVKHSISEFEDYRKQDFDNLKNQYELSNITAEEYYTRLGKLRDVYFKEGSAEWASYTVDILNYNRSVLEEQEKNLTEIFESISAKYNKSFDEIIQKQQNMYQKLNGISKIYNKVSINGGKDGQTYTWLQLSNIDAEIQALKNYNNSITRLKEKTDSIFEGFVDDKAQLNNFKSTFLEQITSMGIGDGIGFSNYLLNISDKRLEDYLEKWIDKLNLTEIISKNMYSDEAEGLARQYSADITSAFSTELTKNLSAVPETFYINGAQACMEFKNGFMKELGNVMNEITLEINAKIEKILGGGTSNNSTVTNNSNYNIYGASSPELTALEIYKQDIRKRMLSN